MGKYLSKTGKAFFILASVCIAIFIVLNLQAATPLIQAADHIDKQLMLALNFDGGMAVDNFWYGVSSRFVWVPLGATLLAILAYYKKSLLIPVIFVIGLAITVTLADQIASSFLKPYFARLRPSRNEEICSLLHFVNGKRGGQYGFVSSHAANAFGVLAFLAPTFRHKATVAALAVWAIIVSYSRIYLGVHYPGDIFCGALLGFTVGLGVHIAMKKLYFKLTSATSKAQAGNLFNGGVESSYMTAAILCTALFIFFYSFAQSAALPFTTLPYVTVL